MTESYPEDLLRREVELKLPVYQDYTEEQLLAEISQLELGSQLETRHRLEGIVEAGAVTPEAVAPIAGLNMTQLGSWFMRGSSFHDIICEPANKNLIKDSITLAQGPGNASVTALLPVLLPMFGIAAPTGVIVFVIPAAIIALAVLLIRYGIDKYCT